MAVGFAPTQAAGILDALGNAVTYTAPTAFWIKLHVGDPGASGTANPAGNTTRVQASFGAAVDGRISNDTAIIWSGVSTTETYTHWSAWTLAAGGTFLYSGTLASAAVTAGNTFTVPVGNLDVVMGVASGVDPPPVSDITHGSQIPWFSADAETFLEVPQPGTLPVIGGVLSGTQTIVGKQISGQCRITAGANILMENCVIVGSVNTGSGSVGASLRLTDGGGARAELRNCLVIARIGVNQIGNTKCVGCIGDNHLKLQRCVIRGGLDNLLWSAPGTPGVWATGDPVVPNARLYITESWFGEAERIGSGHPDLTQIDGVGRGHVLIERSRYAAYNIPIGSDTLTTRVTDRSTASMIGTCFIVTHQLSQSPTNDSHHLALRDSWFEGGNRSTQIGDTLVPPLELTGNLYGIRHNFATHSGDWSKVSDCRWGESGTTAVGGGGTIEAVAGQLIPGSSA